MPKEKTLPSAPVHAVVTTPVFIPLKTEYYEAFCDGSKTVEYRLYGPRWNERTCQIGRRVTISKGYGKQYRTTGRIVGFEKRWMDSGDFVEVYGAAGYAACITIELEKS